MIVFLVGYMGCGKTTIGSKLAKKLHYDFLDLDDFIERSENRTIAKIFKQEGEAGFRGLEQKHLTILKEYNNIVVSTGGGTPCFYDNMDFMNQHGITVYLDMDVNSLCFRLKHGQKTRPLIEGKYDSELKKFVSQHLSERIAYYQQSKIIVNAMAFDEHKIEMLKKQLLLST